MLPVDNTEAENHQNNDHSENETTTDHSEDSSTTKDEVDAVEFGNEQVPAQPQQVEQVVESSHPMITRRRDGIVKPNPRYVLFSVKGVPTEPTTIAEALAHEGWNASMVEEIETCDEIETWSLVPPPEDVHLVGCRWVFKVKLNADGTVQKMRSRLVAKGNQ